MFSTIGYAICIPFAALLRLFYNLTGKSADVNISGLVNTAMQNEARRLRAERWQAENQEGMAEVARFIEMNGSFADENRDW